MTDLSPRRPDHRAFTLIELIVSMSIMTIILGAMTSVMLFVARAVPEGVDPLGAATAGLAVVDELSNDLRYAIEIAESGPQAVAVTVGDRGHGADGPETVRYAWSGTPGDPLTRAYNGSDAVEIVHDVHDFEVVMTIEALPLIAPARVLLVIDHHPKAEDAERQSLIESFGHTVQTVLDQVSRAEFDAAVSASDVIYISSTTHDEEFDDLPLNGPIGIVTEQGDLFDEMHISEGEYTWPSTKINIVNNTHEIMQGLALGDMTIHPDGDSLGFCTGDVAPGATRLAERFGSDLAMIAIEVGGELLDGNVAGGRRVVMPWGNGAIAISELNTNGKLLVRRSVEWAAAPLGTTKAYIRIQVGAETTGTIEVEVPLLNTPEAAP